MPLSLPCVHIHLLSSDQERHLWSSKCFSEACAYLNMPFIWTSLHFWSENFFTCAEEKFCGYWIRVTHNVRSSKVGSSHCYLDRRPLHEIATFNEIVYEYDRKQFHRLVYVALSRVIFITLFNIMRVCRSGYVL